MVRDNWQIKYIAPTLILIVGIVSLLFTSNPSITGYSIIEDNLTGVWIEIENSEYYDNSALFSNTNQSEITYVVNSSNITLITQYRNDFGIIHVYLDDLLIKEIDTYSSTNQYKVAIPIAEISENAIHKLKIQVSGKSNPLSSGNYAVVDALIDSNVTEEDAEEPSIDIGTQEAIGSNGDIRFVAPTPPNATGQTATHVEINISIVVDNLDEITYNWNGTNFTLYNDSLILMMNFENITAIGDNYTSGSNNLSVDISNYRNNGTFADIPVWNTTAKYRSGFSFDGSNDYIIVPTSSSLDSLKEATISLWAKFDSTGDNGLWAFVTNSNDRVHLKAWSSSNLRLYNNIASRNSGSNSPTNSIDTNNWFHIVTTVTGTTWKVYINGNTSSPAISADFGNHFGNLADGFNFQIGRKQFASASYHDGYMDEIIIWNRSLSDAEIYQLYISDIYKYNSTQFYVYINQSHNVTQSLDEASYTYYSTALDDSSNRNSTLIRTVTIDTTFPIWSLNDTNLTNSKISGENVFFNISFNDSNPHQYIFSWYNGTTWINDTAISYSNAEEIKVTKKLGSSSGTINWTWYFNDTAGNINQTNTWVISLPGEDKKPQINYAAPSPENSANQTATNIELNISIEEENLNEVIYNWNGTNFTLYNDSLALMLNFDKESIIEKLNASFSVTTSGNSYHYEDITSVSDYTIQSGDYLEYEVLWLTANDYIAFDYTTSDSTALRSETTATDQNGLRSHPATDISAHALNQWYHRKIQIPASHVGKSIINYDIVIERDETGSYTGYFDNIFITDGAGTVRKTIYNNGNITSALHIQSSASLNVLTNTSEGPQITEEVSSSPYNGTVINAKYNESGKHYGAYDFDGENATIVISSAFGIGIGNFTLSNWVNLDSSSEGGPFIKIGEPNGFGIGVGSTNYDNDGNDLILLYENVRWIDTNVSIGTGWHHVAMVVDEFGYPEAFLDGKSVYSDTTGVGAAATNTTYIGGYEARYVDAFIDEVRIWNRTLSETEVYQEYISSLNKFNSTHWYLYVNQSFNATRVLADTLYTYHITAIDDSSNIKSTPIRTAKVDTTFPVWSVNNTNLTTVTTSGGVVFFNISFNDTNPHQYVFSWYNSTTWINDTAVGYSNAEEIKVTKTLGSSSGTINWTWYFNDTAGNSNQTDVWILSLTGEDKKPQVIYADPTPENSANQTTTNVEINISIIEENLKGFTYNWNGSNFSHYNDSLILIMNFDNISALHENNTFIADLSKSNYHGVWEGQIDEYSGPNCSNAKYGCARMFDGANDILNFTTSLDALKGNTVTMSAWVYVKQFSNDYSPVISQYEGDSSYDGFWLDAGSSSLGPNFWVAYTGDDEWAVSPQVLSLNTWYHLAGTYDGNVVSMYVNGILMNSSIIGSFSGVSETAYIGYEVEDGVKSYFNGSIDEPRIWNRSLTIEEIHQQFISNLNKYNSTHWYLYVNQSFNATRGLTEESYAYYSAALDDSSNINTTPIRTVTIDTTAPIWSVNNTNLSTSTTPGEVVFFNISFNDTHPHQYVFSWYNSTTWINDTAIPYSNAEEIKVTKTLGSSSGTINWTWYFNDTAGNINQTDTWTVAIAVACPNNWVGTGSSSSPCQVTACSELSVSNFYYELTADLEANYNCITVSANNTRFNGNNYNMILNNSNPRETWLIAVNTDVINTTILNMSIITNGTFEEDIEAIRYNSGTTGTLKELFINITTEYEGNNSEVINLLGPSYTIHNNTIIGTTKTNYTIDGIYYEPDRNGDLLNISNNIIYIYGPNEADGIDLEISNKSITTYIQDNHVIVDDDAIELDGVVNTTVLKGNTLVVPDEAIDINGNLSYVTIVNNTLINATEWIEIDDTSYGELNLINITFENENGSVFFPSILNLNFSTDIRENELYIAENYVYVNSSIPQLNTSATLTIQNPKGINIHVASNNTYFKSCTDCTNLTKVGATPTVFNVTRFSAYRVSNFSTINVSVTYPISNFQAPQNELFNISSQVCCQGSDCNGVNVSLDPSGDPPIVHIVHRYTGDPLNIGHCHNRGGSWNCGGVNLLTYSGHGNSLAIDSNNVLHVSSYDIYYRDLDYCNGTSSSWSCSQVITTRSQGQFNSIAIDTEDTIHISHFSNGNLGYCSKSGSTWSCETVDSNGYSGYGTSIAINSKNKVFIAYRDSAKIGHPSHLALCDNSNGSWVCDRIDQADETGRDPSIAIDSNDKIHISHGIADTGDLKYCTDKTGSWKCQTIDSPSYVGTYSSIAVDSNKKVHISHQDTSNADVRYCTDKSGSWNCKKLVDYAQYLGFGTSTAVDSSDKIHISYQAKDAEVGYCTDLSGSWNCQALTSGNINQGSYSSISIEGMSSRSNVVPVQGKGGLISTTDGATPFYTNTTNPYNITLNADTCEDITWFVNSTGTINESYEFFVYANITSDMSISNTSSKWNVTIVERTNPTINFTSPTTQGNTSSNYAFINVTSSDTYFSNLTIRLYNSTGIENESVTTSTDKSINFTKLNNGTYYVNATVMDQFKNINSTTTVQFNIDQIAPGITLHSPSHKFNTTSSSLIFTFSAADNLTLNCSVNSEQEGKVNYIVRSENSSIQPEANVSLNVSGLDERSHSWNVVCSDSLGNTNTSATRTLNIDRTPPIVSIDSPVNGSIVGGIVYIYTTTTDSLTSVASANYNIVNESNSAQILTNGSLNSDWDAIWNSSSLGEVEMNATLIIEANDTVGNFISKNISFYIDNVNPSIQFGNPRKDLDYFKSNISMNIIVQDITLNFTNYSITHSSGTPVQSNSSSFSSSVTELIWNDTINTTGFEEGIYNVSVFASDTAGNFKTSSTLFVYDRSPPDISLYSPAHLFSNNSNVDFNFTSTDNISQSMDCNSTIGKFSRILSCTNNTQCVTNYSGFSDAPYNFTIFCADGATNTKSISSNITVDTTFPIIFFTSPSTIAGNLSQNYISVNTSVIDSNIDSISIALYNYTVAKLNTSENTTSSFFVNYTSLEEGTYHFNATVNDSVGHFTATITRTVLLDYQNPAINVTMNNSNLEVGLDNININWSISDKNIQTVLFNISYPSGQLLYESNYSSGEISLSSSNLTDVGTYNISLRAEDKSGNTNSTTERISVSDTKSPDISIMAPETGNFSKNWIFVNVTTLETQITSILVVVLNSSNSVIDSVEGITSPLSKNFTSLSEGLYKYNATVCDPESCNNSLTYDITLDISSPSIDVQSPNNNSIHNDNNLNITYTAKDTNLHSCWFSNDSMLQNTSLSRCANISNVIWSEKKHTLKIWTNDSSGNLNATQLTFSIDTIAPTLRFGSLTTSDSNLSQSHITIQALSSDINLANVKLYLYNSTGLQSSNEASSSLRITYNNLADGTYYINATSNDTAGNTNATSTKTITLDNTVPKFISLSPINGFNSTSENINFTFNVSDITNLNCNLYMDKPGFVGNTSISSNVSLTSNINNTLLASNLENRTHTWFIECTDNAGNTNSSTPRTITIDRTPPSIVVSTPTNYEVFGYQVYIYSEISDALSNVDFAYFYVLNFTNISEVLASGPLNSSSNWDAAWNSSRYPNSQFNVTLNITANDSLGNIFSMIRNFTVDNVNPSIQFVIPPADLKHYNSNISMNVIVQDSTLNYTNYSILASILSNSTNYSNSNNLHFWLDTIDTSILNDDTYNLSVYASDAGSNSKTISTLFGVDTTLPNVTLNYPLLNLKTNETTLTFNWTVTDNLALSTYCNLTINDVVEKENLICLNNTVCTYTVRGLRFKGYNWMVNCRDDATNANNDAQKPFTSDWRDYDNDNIHDVLDNLVGELKNITRIGVSELNLTVDGDNTLTSFNDSKDVIIYDGTKILVNFTHNFTRKQLVLTNISIKTNSSYILINQSGQLLGNKTMFIDDDSFATLCVKDLEVNDYSEISNDCSGESEIIFDNCIGNNTGIDISGITCTDEGSRIRVDNLQYSAIVGKQSVDTSVVASDPEIIWTPHSKDKVEIQPEIIEEKSKISQKSAEEKTNKEAEKEESLIHQEAWIPKPKTKAYVPVGQAFGYSAHFENKKSWFLIIMFLILILLLYFLTRHNTNRKNKYSKKKPRRKKRKSNKS